MIILFIRGFAGAGKDTFGNIFVQKFGYKRFAFADFLKEMVSAKYGVPLNTLHSQAGKEGYCDDNIRTWRQVLLDEAAEERGRNPDVFAAMCANAIARETAYDNFVITDWRFPNEFRVLRDRFPAAKLFSVLIRRKSQGGVSPVAHPSEYLLLEHSPDFITENNGTEEDLIAKAKYILQLIE
jgi:hypothetical protein